MTDDSGTSEQVSKWVWHSQCNIPEFLTSPSLFHMNTIQIWLLRPRIDTDAVLNNWEVSQPPFVSLCHSVSCDCSHACHDKQPATTKQTYHTDRIKWTPTITWNGRKSWESYEITKCHKYVFIKTKTSAKYSKISLIGSHKFRGHPHGSGKYVRQSSSKIDAFHRHNHNSVQCNT